MEEAQVGHTDPSNPLATLPYWGWTRSRASATQLGYFRVRPQNVSEQEASNRIRVDNQ